MDCGVSIMNLMNIMLMRCRFQWLGLGLGLGLGALGCGPGIASTSDDGPSSTTAASTEAGSSQGSTGPLPGTTVGSAVDSTATDSADADAELCLQWCLGADARGCSPPFTGETCYTRCLSILEGVDQGECGAEYRDVLVCEGQASPPAEPSCEALECEEAYKRHDLCHGSCSHLGGIPGSGGSQTTCDWRGSCYGHDFEVECPVQDAAGLCTCDVDGRIIAECEVGAALSPFECGGDEIHVFTSCCQEAFEGVLFP
jgi:hypothetical protein